MSMTKDQDDELKPKLNRGMELMLRNKKQRKEEGFFNFRIDKVVSLFRKEIHLKFELNIANNYSGENNNV